MDFKSTSKVLYSVTKSLVRDIISLMRLFFWRHYENNKCGDGNSF